jgi:hypothetical protein
MEDMKLAYALRDMIMVEPIVGERFPINTRGREPEAAVCQAVHDLKLPCRMVLKGEQT